MLETARYQWEEGTRRLAATRADAARYRELAALVDAVSDELRRRVGQTFTLAELATAYEGAEDWVRDVIVRATTPAGADARAESGGGESPSVGMRDTALVQDAAFGLFARGATDYRP